MSTENMSADVPTDKLTLILACDDATQLHE